MPIRLSTVTLVAATTLFGLLAGRHADATIVGFPTCTGANSCETTSSPPDVVQDPNDGILLGWNERQNVVLTSDLRVDRVADSTASFVAPDPNGGFLILAGTIVSSHYFQWDPGNQGSLSVEATIEFDSEIFAFITADQKLFDSDTALGLPDVDYNDFGMRGLEGGDATEFQSDRRFVDIDWTATSPGDWTRVITAFSPAAAVPEPGALAVLPVGLLVMGLALRRRASGGQGGRG